MHLSTGAEDDIIYYRFAGSDLGSVGAFSTLIPGVSVRAEETPDTTTEIKGCIEYELAEDEEVRVSQKTRSISVKVVVVAVAAVLL